MELHAHTTASDGRLSPAALVARAAEAGVGLLAVTDHDTMAGIPEALAAGAALGVRVIPAIELSVKAPSGSMHLLGYFPRGETDPQPLAGELAALRERRRRRAERMLESLAALGAPVALERVSEIAAGAPIGRPHLATALVEAGHVADPQEAFDRYLADGRPGHSGHEGLGPQQALALVASSGGVPVLAHPLSLRMPAAALASFVEGLAAAGLRGLEAHRPEHAPDHHRALTALAARHGLLALGGSDFHGRPHDPPLGDAGTPAIAPAAVTALVGAEAAATVGR